MGRGEGGREFLLSLLALSELQGACLSMPQLYEEIKYGHYVNDAGTLRPTLRIQHIWVSRKQTPQESLNFIKLKLKANTQSMSYLSITIKQIGSTMRPCLTPSPH
jgi:hypothetical protein